jgi:hypothetical protein
VCMRVRTCSLAYPAWKSYASYCDVICGPSGSSIFLDIISQTTRFSKKVIEDKMSVLVFSTTLSRTVLILRRNQRDIVINVKTSSCKVLVVLVGF